MVLVNGVATDRLAVDDRGLHYGDGLFETLAILDGHAPLWSRHMARLHRGCRALGIVTPDTDALHDEVFHLCAGRPRAVLKLLITRGSGRRGYRPPEPAVPTRILMLGDWPAHPPAWHDEGVDVRTCDMRLSRNPVLAGHKHLNRLEQVLARAEWGDEFQEGLMLDIDGWVVEGTMSNLFVVKDGTLLTPPIEQCGVAGIMRGLVMETAQAIGIPCEERNLRREDLDRTEGMFLSNTLIGLWPLRSLDGRPTPRHGCVPVLRSAIHERHGVPQ